MARGRNRDRFGANLQNTAHMRRQAQAIRDAQTEAWRRPVERALGPEGTGPEEAPGMTYAEFERMARAQLRGIPLRILEPERISAPSPTGRSETDHLARALSGLAQQSVRLGSILRVHRNMLAGQETMLPFRPAREHSIQGAGVALGSILRNAVSLGVVDASTTMTLLGPEVGVTTSSRACTFGHITGQGFCPVPGGNEALERIHVRLDMDALLSAISGVRCPVNQADMLDVIPLRVRAFGYWSNRCGNEGKGMGLGAFTTLDPVPLSTLLTPDLMRGLLDTAADVTAPSSLSLRRSVTADLEVMLHRMCYGRVARWRMARVNPALASLYIGLAPLAFLYMVYISEHGSPDWDSFLPDTPFPYEAFLPLTKSAGEVYRRYAGEDFPWVPRHKYEEEKVIRRPTRTFLGRPVEVVRDRDGGLFIRKSTEDSD